MKVSDLMTTDVATVAPETALKEVAGLLIERGISGAPVVEGDRVVGVVSERDILFKERSSTGLHRGVLAWLMDETDLTIKFDARTAREAMSSPPVTIASGRQVADAARLMLDENISRLPVVDSGRLVGILTESDLVRAFARSDEAIRREILDEMLVKTFGGSGKSLDVAVRDGDVTVTGTVATKQQAQLIETLVDKVPGVVTTDVRLRWGDAA
jgi:CBS domain-containing protein